MTEFTPWMSLVGGMFIGLSAVTLMALHGRIAGLSHILAGAVLPSQSLRGWRIAFLVGAVAAPLALSSVPGVTIPFSSATPLPWLIFGGVLVGIGVQLGSGCTSGHGVCGLARFSTRSVVATLCFMATTAATVFVVRHVFGGF
ncbi:YeeE/YedE family protein [Phaeovibrio sulfidiphilus]|uniref:YeeE/YedE family protein n=1 Tax=Phaeovibrio sulfidiphilus TaxID=1220600 RepID=A0A8J7CQH6_9PROT|nr:YeeE/YedE thiosulfate transporter family protein [Phaeovibrio sulfidiphilus]MBE1236840.1 YeeE/YedE family protein [Phaeovibrio sulfidiphilus]